MKLLVTSDLHGRRDWFAWLLLATKNHDALVIAGDLLDQNSDPLLQIGFLRVWVEEFSRTGKLLFLCDGNHDAFPAVAWPRETTPSRWTDFVVRAQVAEHWTMALLEEGADIVGGMTRLLEGAQLIVTSLFDQPDDSVALLLLQEGAALRRRARVPWIVLSHRPPPGLLASPSASSTALAAWIEEFQPNAIFTGHDHEAPARSGTCCEQIGLSKVFNVGNNSLGRRPHSLTIDMATMRFSWAR